MTKPTALLLLSLLILAAGTARSQFETINFDYDFSGPPAPTTLTFQGQAFMRFDHPYLVLARETFNVVGRVLHTAPVPIRTADRTLVSFYSTIKFLITPLNAQNAPAEGITFFIAPVGTTYPTNSFGGNLGVYNEAGLAPNTLVVEFDTNPNQGYYDPTYQHIGINIGTIISSNVTNMYNVMVGQEVTAEISFARPESRLNVRVTIGRAIYEVSSTYPLFTFLPDQVQFGLSASSAINIARPDIISWHNNYTVAVRPQIREVVV